MEIARKGEEACWSAVLGGWLGHGDREVCGCVEEMGMRDGTYC